MKNKEEILFKKLEKEIAKIFLQDFSSSNPDISQWKGLDIIYFQEHLRKKVKGNVSEKWFYTYFKSEFEKLPRIDMLNLLAQYCDYQSWSDFVNKNNATTLEDTLSEGQEEEEKTPINKELLQAETESPEAKPVVYPSDSKDNKKFRKKSIYISVISILLMSLIGFGIYYFEQQNSFTFSFYDSDRGTLIKNKLEIIVMKKGLSNEYYYSTDGTFSHKSAEDTLKIKVSSPMYKSEEFVISLKDMRDGNEANERNFRLRPDDYAIMLSYYSSGISGNDKQKAEKIIQRKQELDKLIADNALIYQVYDSDAFGQEQLDKKKYIDFMTTPTTSLKNYVLISSQTNHDNKINLIKFKIQKNEN